MTYIPQIASRFSVNFVGLRSEGAQGDAEEGQDLFLQVGELGVEELHGSAAAEQHVPLGMTEEPEHLLRRRPFAAALLGVERELGDPSPSHGRPELALDERLHEQPQEVEREERFDAPGVLGSGFKPHLRWSGFEFVA